MPPGCRSVVTEITVFTSCPYACPCLWVPACLSCIGAGVLPEWIIIVYRPLLPLYRLRARKQIPNAKTPEMPKEAASRLCKLFSKGLTRRIWRVAKAMNYGIIRIIRTGGQRSLLQEGAAKGVDP